MWFYSNNFSGFPISGYLDFCDFPCKVQFKNYGGKTSTMLDTVYGCSEAVIGEAA